MNKFGILHQLGIVYIQIKNKMGGEKMNKNKKNF